ncbi:MAG: hypothetical protein ACK41E_11580 [Deinococcales bacterium]
MIGDLAAPGVLGFIGGLLFLQASRSNVAKLKPLHKKEQALFIS